MESPAKASTVTTKASTVNGTPQKATKHQGTRLETDVEGNGYGRAETIEDIISELNATAKRDTSLAEAFDDVILNDDGQQSLDALDQCDPITDAKDSLSGSGDGGEVCSTPASAREEAKSAVVLTDDSAPAEGDGTAVSSASEIDSQGASKVVKAANGDSDQPLESQEVTECTDTLETDAEEKFVNECTENEAADFSNVTDADDCSGEVITGDIKAPDQAVMSPRRTARQRTASLKVTENAAVTPRRKTRHGSEASDASPVDPSSKKQELKEGCVTSDSEVDAPLSTRKLRKPSAEGGGTKVTAKAKRLTSDSDGDTPLAKMKRKPKLAKKVASESEGDSSIPAIVKRSPKLAKRLASDSEGDSPLVKRKRNPRLANRLSSESDSSSMLAKRKGIVKVLLKKMPQHSETKEGDAQSVEPPSKKKPRKSLMKELTEDKGTMKSNDRKDLQSSEQSSTKRGKPMDSEMVQNLASKAKRIAFHVEECPVNNSIMSAKHSSDEGNEDSCRVPKPKKVKDKAGSGMERTLDSRGAESTVVSKKNRALEPKDSSVGLNAGNTAATRVTRADERANHFTVSNTFAQSAEGAQLSPHHFRASDRHLQKCIQLSVRKCEPSVRPSYLTIEVPSVTAGRMWGPTFSRQRPTVVFGGCDPLNTYVNVHGVRVPLHQWQKVSNITPTIRLADIFRCFKHM
ncbi:hepatoma-derived growth factor-related protein 2 isoform X2 [Rhipicephalus sanguineus]|uniref:hepatoma-derived growth factor-related protein 2 isoform X2 n=1 Tax=Rhipicephalus sanguineus TaxID=34632 RepID=UPI0020C36782|nr:hepatoma-derived growth factor-related protein 2 isoform X2 [Rhipicephalus sanguineus]